MRLLALQLAQARVVPLSSAERYQLKISSFGYGIPASWRHYSIVVQEGGYFALKLCCRSLG